MRFTEKRGNKREIFKKVGLAISGLFVGALNGLFGGGGGMLVVPCLNRLGGLDEKTSHATAIAVILPLSIVSGIIYIANGSFSLNIGLITTAGVILGGIVGATALKKISGSALSMIFYTLMIAAGIKMII